MINSLYKKYELARNWCIGNAFVEKTNKKFILVSLIRKNTETDLKQKMEEAILNQNNNMTYKILYWEDIYENIKENPELKELKYYFENTATFINNKIKKSFTIYSE